MGRLEPGSNGDDIRRKLASGSPAAQWCRENGASQRDLDRKAMDRWIGMVPVGDLFEEIVRENGLDSGA